MAKVLSRHQNELLSRLERVAERGSCEITFYELLLWYRQARFSATIWRDIADKFAEICAEQDYEPGRTLLAGEGNGFYTFIWGEGLTTGGEESWFEDVETLARRKTETVDEVA